MVGQNSDIGGLFKISMPRFFKLFVILQPFVWFSCSSDECINHIRELQVNAVNTDAYNIALMRWINTTEPDEVEYVFRELINEGLEQAIIVEVRIEGQCAMARYRFDDLSLALEVTIDIQDNGYRGASLNGFEQEVDGSSGGIVLVCTAIESIAD